MNSNRWHFIVPLKRKIGNVVFPLLLLISGCSGKSAPAGPDFISGTGEEYSVYRTLIADSNFYRAGTVVILDSTQAWDFSNSEAPWKGRMPRLSDETLQQYLSVNRTRVPLQVISCPGKTCVLISCEKMADWERMFPDAAGVVTVSRVGFNRAGTQALAYWSVYLAPLAASGSVILLEKEDGRWTVRQNLMIWIS
jgi:hypothetical protein